MEKLASSALIAAAFVLGSCATIISGTSQAISIDSNIPGATVKIEGNSVGVTPFTGKVKRQKEALAVVSKDGYQSQTLVLTTSYNPVAILSIVWDYSTTDCLTGAVWEYAPNSYYVDLKPNEVSEKDFRESAELKALAMTYHAEFALEVAAGSGPLLESLHSRYFASASLGELQREIAVLSELSSIEFGEAVLLLRDAWA
jgi:hypothetical protein